MQITALATIVCKQGRTGCSKVKKVPLSHSLPEEKFAGCKLQRTHPGVECLCVHLKGCQQAPPVVATFTVPPAAYNS